MLAETSIPKKLLLAFNLTVKKKIQQDFKVSTRERSTQELLVRFFISNPYLKVIPKIKLGSYCQKTDCITANIEEVAFSVLTENQLFSSNSFYPEFIERGLISA